MKFFGHQQLRIYGVLMAATSPILAFGASDGVDYYSASELQQKAAALGANAKPNSSTPVVNPLTKYTNDYTLLVYRNANGQAEMHQHESDLYLVVDGEATLLSGGTMLQKHEKSAGEFLGSGIKGGHAQKLSKGDVVHISPNIPHQLMVGPGHTFSYFVLKVKE